MVYWNQVPLDWGSLASISDQAFLVLLRVGLIGEELRYLPMECPCRVRLVAHRSVFLSVPVWVMRTAYHPGVLSAALVNHLFNLRPVVEPVVAALLTWPGNLGTKPIPACAGERRQWKEPGTGERPYPLECRADSVSLLPRWCLMGRLRHAIERLVRSRVGTIMPPKYGIRQNNAIQHNAPECCRCNGGRGGHRLALAWMSAHLSISVSKLSASAGSKPPSAIWA